MAAVNLSSAIKGKVAVYIDAANLEQSVKALGQTPPLHLKKGQVWRSQPAVWTVDYRKLRALFEKHATKVSFSLYTPAFGSASHQRFLTYLKKNGYRIVSKPVKNIKNQDALVVKKCKHCKAINKIDVAFTCQACGKRNDVPIERKANFDVEIASDAISWQNNYDTFVLISGDSDFVYLIQTLKTRYKKSVIVLSRRGHIADELRNSPYIDFYQDWYKLKDQFLAKGALKRQKPRNAGF